MRSNETKRTPVGSLFKIIHTPGYFPLWLGQLVSNFGDTLNYIALVVLVFQISGQRLAVSGLVVFKVLPYILLGSVAGVVIDRVNRKTVLADQIWQIYLITTLLTSAAVFFQPTLNAVIPAVVPSQSLLAANSVAWSTGRLVQIVASALAGGLISWVGVNLAFGLNAASFLFSACYFWWE